MAELVDNVPMAIAALSELAGRGDPAFGEAGHLAAVAGEAGRAFEQHDGECGLQVMDDQQARR